MKKALLPLLTATLFYSSYAQAETLQIFSGDDTGKFLGCLTCSKNDPKSVFNHNSEFGIKNSKGIWGNKSVYKSLYSDLSACNRYADNPPVIKNEQNKIVGEFSNNPFDDDSICSITRPGKTCVIVTNICKGHH